MDSCRHWVVEESATPEVPVLDPVVVQALENLTSFVFRRRRIYSLRLERRNKSLADPGALAGAVTELPPKPSARWIEGRATFTMLKSRTTMNDPTKTKVSAHFDNSSARSFSPGSATPSVCT